MSYVAVAKVDPVDNEDEEEDDDESSKGGEDDGVEDDTDDNEGDDAKTPGVKPPVSTDPWDSSVTVIVC